MKMFVTIANIIYEIDRLGNARIVYTGAENMTIQAVDGLSLSKSITLFQRSICA